PPLFSRRNDKGELVKKKFGPWVMSVFKVLARLKGLRGTAFDVFDKTAERRQERQLVREYLELVNELSESLTEQNLAVAIELARLPDDIRGFGHVKEKNLLAAQARRSELLNSYRTAVPLGRVA